MDEQFGRSGIKGRIVIWSSNNDFLVLCLHYYPQTQNTQELWVLVGVTTNLICPYPWSVSVTWTIILLSFVNCTRADCIRYHFINIWHWQKVCSEGLEKHTNGFQWMVTTSRAGHQSGSCKQIYGIVWPEKEICSLPYRLQ